MTMACVNFASGVGKSCTILGGTDLAALTSDDAVVNTGRFVTADLTWYHLNVR